MTDRSPFYERKTLSEMTLEEWESLCDGCGQCCVVLLADDEDEDTVWRTDLGCKLLDLKTVRCSDYANRHRKVPGCVKLRPDNIQALGWMPETCAYRLIHEGKPLFDWHPLKSGEAQSVQRAGVSVKGALVSETAVHEDDFEDHIIAMQCIKRG